MAEKSIKNWKSLSVFPGIVRCSDKGCLKKNYFPFGDYHFERFPLCIVSAGEVIPGPLSMASRTLFVVGVLAWRSSALPNNTVCQGLRARSVPQLQWQKYQQTHQVPPSHTMAESGHGAADPPSSLLSMIYVVFPSSLGSGNHVECRKNFRFY